MSAEGAWLAHNVQVPFHVMASLDGRGFLACRIVVVPQKLMCMQVERLQEEKAAAVAAENYDEAKRLKLAIDRCPRPLCVTAALAPQRLRCLLRFS